MPPSALQQFDRLADRIRAVRAKDPRPAVVVEGEPDKVFVRRIFGDAVRIYQGGPRHKVVEAARQIADWSMTAVGCLVDRDFDDEVEALQAQLDNLVSYDGTDLESMLWSGVSLDNFLHEWTSGDKLDGFGGVAAVRTAVEAAVVPLARLRRASSLHGWGLDFKSLDLARKVHRDSLAVSIEGVCNALWRDDLAVNVGHLIETAGSEQFDVSCPHTGRPRFRGKDALVVVGVGLRKRLGSMTAQGTKPQVLEQGLRSSVSEGDVAATAWRERMRAVLGL